MIWWYLWGFCSRPTGTCRVWCKVITISSCAQLCQSFGGRCQALFMTTLWDSNCQTMGGFHMRGMANCNENILNSIRPLPILIFVLLSSIFLMQCHVKGWKPFLEYTNIIQLSIVKVTPPSYCHCYSILSLHYHVQSITCKQSF